MQNKWQSKLKRVVSVTITAVLVLQGFLPSGFIGISPAQAATQTYTYTTAGNYGTDSNTEIFDGNAVFNMTWEDTGDQLTLEDDTTTVVNLISPALSGLVLATNANGKLHRSTDYGETFANVTPAGGFTAVDIVETSGDSNDLVAVGGSAITPLYYSTDNGLNWTQSGGVIADAFVAATHDSGDNHTWALAESGSSYYSENAGDTWTSFTGTGLDEGSDILWYTGDTLFASGVKTGVGQVYYSTDSGSNWAAASLPGSIPGNITDMAMNGTTLYVGGEDYVAKFDFGQEVITDFDDPNSWTDLSSIVASGNFSNLGGIMTSNGVVFISLYDTTASEPRIYGTINDDTDWQEHGGPVAGYVNPTALVRLYATGRIVWGCQDSGGYAELMHSKHYEVDDSVIALTGISATSIEAIEISYHANNEVDELGLALGFATGETNTWYYYDTTAEGGTGAWVGSTIDSSVKSTVGGGVSGYDARIDEFDDDIIIVGDIYFKLYLHEGPDVRSSTPLTHPFALIDSIAVTYTESTITLLSPNGDEEWNVGSNHDITWEYSVGYDPSTVLIQYSINSGASTVDIDTNWTGGSPYSNWLIPEENDFTKIIITAGSITDSSDDYFRMIMPSGGGSNDQTAPSSEIDDLPEYTTDTQFDIFVDASDTGGAGLKTVDLYFSSSGNNTTYLWNTWDITDPNRVPMQDNKVVFNFDTEDELAWGDGTYNFYSCATDFSNNSSCNSKRLPYAGSTPPNIEAFTTVDTNLPHLVGIIPSNLTTRASVDQAIVIDFSEPVDINTFTYQFYKTEYPDEFVTDTTNGWFLGNTRVIVTHIQLEHETWYTFNITDVKDVAGNTVQSQDIPSEWYFKTAPNLDPDLTTSTIVANEGPNEDGSYSTGDVIDYTITLTNTSDLIASNATTSLTFADYLTYKTGSAVSSAGTVSLQQRDGEMVGFDWNGIIIQGTNVTITFQATIGNIVDRLQIQQLIMISDNVNFDYFPAPATINITPTPNFETSTLIVNLNKAPAGASLFYTVTVANTGSTISEVSMVDVMPEELIFVRGTLSGHENWQTLEYDEELDKIEATTILPTQSQVSFSFYVRIKSTLETDHVVVNSITIQNPNSLDATQVIRAETIIDNSIQLSPELAQIFPLPNARGVGLDSKIHLQFNVAIDTQSFEFAISYVYYNQKIEGWNIKWDNGNTTATISPPNRLAVGATYEIEIVHAEDEAGNILAEGTFASKWRFTTVSPAVTLTEFDNPLLMIQTDKISRPIVVGLIDVVTGEPYVTPEKINIQIKGSSLSGSVIPAGIKDIFRSPNRRVTIAADTSETVFYYQDSKSSLPGHLTLDLFEQPSQGFLDTTLYVVVLNKFNTSPNDMLKITVQSSDIKEPGSFSAPLMVTAYSVQGSSIPLPDILYFHSPSPTGLFYDGSLNPLPKGVSIQSVNGSESIQYFESSFPLNSAIFYYRDTGVGTNVITIADNPLSATSAGSVLDTEDPGFTNANAVLNVLRPVHSTEQQNTEVAQLAGIKSVNDGTGRVLNHIKILPTSTQILPSESKTFYAQGYDNTDRAIPYLEFTWYTPSYNDGDITDISSTTDKAIFTAGETVGTFYDAIMVVAMYNGKIKYATTDIAITDMVEYEQPTHLPVSGWNGLQLIFMALTLAAAVLLAWVEHYDKTHFKPNKKKA